MHIGAIDIGGTSIKTAISNEYGELTNPKAYPTEAEKGGSHLMEKILMICEEMQTVEKLDGVAISSAGQVDAENGSIIYATDTIPGYSGMNVCEQVTTKFNVPATMDNDVNCTALGEQWVGAARNVKDFLTVTLGTGIGGALFINGRLYRGATFSGGEIGHMILHPGGKMCTCTQAGCYERYASSAALAAAVQQQFGEVELPAFFDMIRSGNDEAIVIFEKWMDDLTTGLASLVLILNPSVVVIGGGISAQGELLQEAIQTSLESKLMPNHKKELTVVLAERGNDANLLGAVRHFLNNNPVQDD
ncbi:ROK family protein [Sporosarcina gallistercoris]|uniref:ROK family protein n=1 Tax=Sporosarcina gallistercoris TaxID=2762245 RepID=A0ABR8PIZ0_9BACL|nr:ROK family protein [Sporosarcina gallistercoris]MBD7908162.1 ROK family protein [Sporosarcina gallistercoris]